MHFCGITVVIICKMFEIMKSDITILPNDYDIYLHTSSKKQKNFEWYHYPEHVTQFRKKAIFGSDRNFWPEVLKFSWVKNISLFGCHLQRFLILIKKFTTLNILRPCRPTLILESGIFRILVPTNAIIIIFLLESTTESQNKYQISFLRYHYKFLWHSAAKVFTKSICVLPNCLFFFEGLLIHTIFDQFPRFLKYIR